MPTISAGSSQTFTAGVKDQLFTLTANGGALGTVTGAVSASFGPGAERRSFGPFAVGQAITVTVQAGSVIVEYGDSTPENEGQNSQVTGSDGGLSVGGAVARLGTHVRAALLGDSHTSRHWDAAYPTMATTALGPWTWANQMIGSPFVFTQNLGISGDVTRSIMARANCIPSNVQAVFVMAGTNDVINMSAAANQATIDSTYTNVSGYLGSGVANLVARGKKVVIATILPNNAFTPSTDSRIQLLDRLNAYIATIPAAYPGSVWVVDAFTATWDSAIPATRVFKSFAANSDGTHLTAAGAQAVGLAAMTAATSMFNACLPDLDIYENFFPVRALYSQFRTGTGGTAGVISAGTGTLADGWRSINNAGTATFTLAQAAYSEPQTFVGDWVMAPDSIDTYSQVFNVTSAIANDNPRLRLPANTDLVNTGTTLADQAFGGSEYFMEIEVKVENPVNLREVNLTVAAFFGAGTSPADQPYTGTTTLTVRTASANNLGSTVAALQNGYTAVLRTPVVRLPENVNNVSGFQLTPSADIVFMGTGSATVSFSRPRIWHKPAGRIF